MAALLPVSQREGHNEMLPATMVLFLCWCVSVYLCECVWPAISYLQRPEENVRTLWAEDTGSYELPALSAGNWTPVLCTGLFVNDTNWMWRRGLKLLKTPRPVASTRYPWWLMAVQNQHYFLVKAFCHFSFSGAQWWAPLGTEKWPFLLKGFVIVKSPIGSFETETMNFWSMSVFPRKILLLNCFGS